MEAWRGKHQTWGVVHYGKGQTEFNRAEIKRDEIVIKTIRKGGMRSQNKTSH